MDLCKDYAGMYKNIIQQGVNYLERYPDIKSMVVGLSGGIDSALSAAIARDICDRTDKHQLIGISIPIESNKKTEIERAKLAGKSFCHKFIEVKWINRVYPLFKWFVFKRRPGTGQKIRFGNIKARFRMIYLYDRAHWHNGVVLSTDNLTEFNLGFWTLHGDVGDLGFIQQLWKTEVYGLANYLCAQYDKIIGDTCGTGWAWTEYADKQVALLKAISAVPTDGLGITRNDFSQIEVNDYKEADDLLIEYIKGGSKDKLLEKHPVIRRHLKYAFKHSNPYNISRELIIPKPKPMMLNLL